MPTTVIQNVALQLTVTIGATPVNFECQVIDASISLPGEQPGDTIEVACPDGKVSDPGTSQNGAFTGTVFTDTTATGITWALMQAFKDGVEFTYSFEWFSDLAPTHAVLFTGSAKVNTFQMDWAKPGNAKHPLDLALITTTIGRPAAA